MKLGAIKYENFFEGRELAKINDNIYNVNIEVDEIHSYINKKGERKVIFTIVNDLNNYYYMPESIGMRISDEDIENINSGFDVIKGKFIKVKTKKGFECWSFEDLD